MKHNSTSTKSIIVSCILVVLLVVTGYSILKNNRIKNITGNKDATELNNKLKPHRKETFVFDKKTREILSKQYSEAIKYFESLSWNLEDNNPETNGNIDLVLKGLNKFSRDDQPVALDRFTKVKYAQTNINKFYGKKLLFKGQSIKVFKGAAKSVISDKVNKGNEYDILNLTTEDGFVELIIVGESNYYGNEEETGTTISGWPIGIGTKGQIILLNNRKI